MEGALPRDLSAAVPPPRQFKQRGLRDALTEGEVTRLLDGVDRSSAIGRRDYAVLLLAARYGLRPCDLRQLRLDAVDWREGVLSITQAKTGRVLTLPLLPDIADALIAYLRDGRPPTTSRQVFVRHKAPFEPFVAANNLAAIMRQALRRVGLEQRDGRRGLYLLRHTLATRMLASGSPLKRIGDVLGHASTDTTMEYASVDLTALRRVAISETEVRPWTAGTCRPHSTWSSPLAAALQRFLEGKRAAGYRYRAEAETLSVLDRFLGETLSPTDPVITSAIVRAFVARRGTESETTRAHRLALIREVCRFLALDDPRTFVPAARFLDIQHRTGVPRVLSLDEGRRFLDACDTLDRPRSSPRRELVLRTLLVLLYLTGLRAGEGLRLTLADVDLETAVLRIRDTKFGKSRLVPVAADVAARLAYCRDTVTDELGERTPGEPFFPAPSGQPYSLSALRSAFHAVLVAAGIPRWQGGRSLRLHDLRHSFAVLRLTLWYRQQASLGNLLPALATYLGHVGIASSQRYLQLTEDIAADLTHRYAVRFGHLLSDGGRR